LIEEAIPNWADNNLSKELPVLRARGESQEIEYIEFFPKQAHDLGKEIAAFASSNPGTILIGVTDEGDLKGLDNASTNEERDRYLRRIEGICRGTIKPSITPTVKYACEDGKTIIAIFVPKGSQPVYYSNDRPYVRHITESRPAEPHEVIDLIRKWLPTSYFEEEAADPFLQIVSELSTILIDVLIFGEEAEQRDCNPWLDMWRSQFAQAASELRDIAVNDIAIEKGLSNELNEIAGLLDGVANFTMTMGCWPELKADIEKVLEKANKIKTKWIDTVSLSEASLSQIKKTIVESERKLTNICLRAKDGDYIWRKADDFQAEVSDIGYILLRVSYYNLDAIKQGLNSALQPIAKDLHLVETERLYLDGGNSIKKLLERVENDSVEIKRIVSSI
jgi:hypothetical protein